MPGSEIGIVVSLVPGFENSGAGGSGLRGLPPYCDEGVPGLGLPFRSAGSYWGAIEGARVQSIEPPRDGVLGRTGEVTRSCIVYGGTDGILPSLDAGLLGDMSADGCGRWYRSGTGLIGTGCGILFR